MSLYDTELSRAALNSERRRHGEAASRRLKIVQFASCRPSACSGLSDY
jgi:hypothetical protein